VNGSNALSYSLITSLILGKHHELSQCETQTADSALRQPRPLEGRFACQALQSAAPGGGGTPR